MFEAFLLWLGAINPLVIVALYLGIGFAISMLICYLDPVDDGGGPFMVAIFWGLGIPFIAAAAVIFPFYLIWQFVTEAGKARKNRGKAATVAPKAEESL